MLSSLIDLNFNCTTGPFELAEGLCQFRPAPMNPMMAEVCGSVTKMVFAPDPPG